MIAAGGASGGAASVVANNMVIRRNLEGQRCKAADIAVAIIVVAAVAFIIYVCHRAVLDAKKKGGRRA